MKKKSIWKRENKFSIKNRRHKLKKKYLKGNSSQTGFKLSALLQHRDDEIFEMLGKNLNFILQGIKKSMVCFVSEKWFHCSQPTQDFEKNIQNLGIWWKYVEYIVEKFVAVKVGWKHFNITV
jgi:hypothetical protein